MGEDRRWTLMRVTTLIGLLFHVRYLAGSRHRRQDLHVARRARRPRSVEAGLSSRAIPATLRRLQQKREPSSDETALRGVQRRAQLASGAISGSECQRMLFVVPMKHYSAVVFGECPVM
jgi:hypothetical protein